jgi:hypothetical protein
MEIKSHAVAKTNCIEAQREFGQQKLQINDLSEKINVLEEKKAILDVCMHND